jgi:hypothetical protein
MVPSRATICSGMVAVRDPDEIERSAADAENRPPAPASHIVTTTESETPIRRSGAGPTSLNTRLKDSRGCDALMLAMRSSMSSST